MRADSLSTVAELIDAFGGITPFSKVIEKGVSTAGEMKRSGRIDVDYWPPVIAAAPAVGIDGLDEKHMARIQARRRASASRQASEAAQ